MPPAVDFTALIRDIPDFPEPGIIYKDITPLLADPHGYGQAIDALASPWAATHIDLVAGMEARGFLFGVSVAQALGVGFVPVRKAGKLPHETTGIDYGLEYGSDTLEIHTDAVAAGQSVLLIDDVLATGGTAAATAELVRRCGGEVAGFGFLLELTFLDGRAGLGSSRVESLIEVGG